MILNPSTKIFGNPILPGDKSISHRCLILAALANGISTFDNVSEAEDVLSTQKVLMQLGADVQRDGTYVRVISQGSLKKSLKPLDCGNAGTLMRLMMGVLSAQDFESTLIGDESLSSRPMKRVAEPLFKMGANINLRDNQYAPIDIKPSRLKGYTYELPIASAQVKSALLLAGLFVDTKISLTGKIKSRDHSERLLELFGAKVISSNDSVELAGNQKLKSVEYTIPNDISAASFWIAAGLLAQKSDVLLKNVGINPTRMGFIEILQSSGAEINMEPMVQHPEPSANLKIKNSKLTAFKISEDLIPSLIDEVPLLVLIATQCEGTSEICGLEELRYKETDRIKSTVEAIRALGGTIEVRGNDLVIPGNQKLSGGVVNSYQDHRIAMMAAVARYCTEGSVEIQNFECAQISDPYFAKQIVEFT